MQHRQQQQQNELQQQQQMLPQQQQSQQQQQQQPGALFATLRLCSKLPHTWHGLQPLPPLTIRLLDAATEAYITDTPGWEITCSIIHICEGGSSSAETTPPSITSTNKTFPMDGGVALVNNLAIPPPDNSLQNWAARLCFHVVSPARARPVVGREVTEAIALFRSEPIHDQINSLPKASAPGPGGGLDVKYALRFGDELEEVWYADRHHRRFRIELFDESTGRIVETASDMTIQLTLTDGFNNDATSKLRDEIKTHHFSLSRGKAFVTGLRFSGVSSKCGGYFRVVARVSQPPAMRDCVKPGVSNKVQVLSYRLYHNPKLSLEKLTPDDAIGKVPGIGTLYAKRFGQLGVTQVWQLAAVNLDDYEESQVMRILEALRKERGSMTAAKLAEYIEKARTVVRRYEQQRRAEGGQEQHPEQPHHQQHQKHHQESQHQQHQHHEQQEQHRQQDQQHQQHRQQDQQHQQPHHQQHHHEQQPPHHHHGQQQQQQHHQQHQQQQHHQHHQHQQHHQHHGQQHESRHEEKEVVAEGRMSLPNTMTKSSSFQFKMMHDSLREIPNQINTTPISDKPAERGFLDRDDGVAGGGEVVVVDGADENDRSGHNNREFQALHPQRQCHDAVHPQHQQHQQQQVVEQSLPQSPPHLLPHLSIDQHGVATCGDTNSDNPGAFISPTPHQNDDDTGCALFFPSELGVRQGSMSITKNHHQKRTRVVPIPPQQQQQQHQQQQPLLEGADIVGGFPVLGGVEQEGDQRHNPEPESNVWRSPSMKMAYVPRT